MIRPLARVLSQRCLPGLFMLVGMLAATPAMAEINLPQANGDTLTLPAAAQRIVTLAPNLAELVFAAGAGQHLKAVVEYSNFPAQVQQLPRLGDAFRIDLEGIIDLKPDLVIAWKSGNPQTALQKLEQLGVTVWQIEITHPEQIAEVVENIAMAADTRDEGLATARRLRDKLAGLRQRNAGKSAVSYFYQIAARPLYTINGQHIISRSLEVCGGRNVFAELAALAPQISRESVILANPQTMLAPAIAGEPPALLQWLEWPRLQAVKNAHLLYLPADEISQATPRLLDSIELACKLLDEVRGATQAPENQ